MRSSATVRQISVITARLRDHDGNLVPNGRSVSFSIPEYPGQLQPYVAQTANGEVRTDASFGPSPTYPQPWFHVQVNSGRMEASIRVLSPPARPSEPVPAHRRQHPRCNFAAMPHPDAVPVRARRWEPSVPLAAMRHADAVPPVRQPVAALRPSRRHARRPRRSRARLPVEARRQSPACSPTATATPACASEFHVLNGNCVRETDNQYIVDADASAEGIHSSVTMQVGEEQGHRVDPR